MIYHYTSINTLALILESKKIRFSRLDTVDDVTESQTIHHTNLMSYFFVSCWQKTEEENPALWHMYGDNKRGVRIGFKGSPFYSHQMIFPASCGIVGEGRLASPLKFEQLCSTNYLVFPIFGNAFFGEVEYFKDHIAERNKHLSITPGANGTQNMQASFLKLPRIKNQVWSFQDEIRFSLVILPPYKTPPDSSSWGINMIHHLAASVYEKKLPDIPHFDLEMDPKMLDSIEVTTGPCASEAEKLIIESLINTYTQNGSIRPSNLRVQK